MTESLCEWWATNRPRLRLPVELVEVMERWCASGWTDETRVTRLWNEILQRQLKAISDLGFDEASGELARNYFLALKPWTSPALGRTQSEGFTYLMKRLQTSGRNLTPLLQPLPLSPETNLYHNAILLSLLEILGADPWLKKAQVIEKDFHTGFEPQITVDGFTYSQDLLNSAIEARWILRASAPAFKGEPLKLDRERSSAGGGPVLIDYGGGNSRFTRFSLLSGLFEKAICIDIPPAIIVQRQALRGVFDRTVIDAWRFSESQLSRAFSKFLEAKEGIMLLLPHQAPLITSLPKPTFFYCNDMLHEQTKVSKDEVISVATRLADFAFFSVANKYELEGVDQEWTVKTLGFPRAWKLLKQEKREWPSDYQMLLFQVK